MRCSFNVGLHPPRTGIAAAANKGTSPQLQTEVVLWRRVRTPAGRGAEPCGVARQNTEDRRKGRA
eukprot:COSAG06_NODE_45698_length_352_cov_2.833992_1_plen_64_part_01